MVLVKMYTSCILKYRPEMQFGFSMSTKILSLWLWPIKLNLKLEVDRHGWCPYKMKLLRLFLSDWKVTREKYITFRCVMNSSTQILSKWNFWLVIQENRKKLLSRYQCHLVTKTLHKTMNRSKCKAHCPVVCTRVEKRWFAMLQVSSQKSDKRIFYLHRKWVTSL